MHDLSFIGWGVVIPIDLIKPHLDIYDTAEEHDLKVDWIEYPSGYDDSIYIVTLKSTRQEIYDQTVEWINEPYAEYTFRVSRFLYQMEITEGLKTGWILAQYRM